MQKAAESEISKLRQELEEYKGKTAQEMAELTSQNDKLTLRLKKTREENKAKFTSERKLKNGNTEYNTVKPNGTIATKEVTPTGDIVEYKVRTVEGMVRHGKINPKTKQPVKTFDNSTGKDLLTVYNDHKSTTKEVNSTKTKKRSSCNH